MKLGKSTLNVKITGSCGNTVTVGKDILIWSNKIDNVKIDGKKAVKYSLPNNSKFTINIDGQNVVLDLKSKKPANVETATNPNYNWKNYTFTATYKGKSGINKTTKTLKVNTRIANTDVYNVDMIPVINKKYPTKAKLAKFLSNKANKNLYNKYKAYYILHRVDIS
ncbi:hypothetical protein ALNOE001_12600 [Candidatus Methanobinarius endosymbioticus]|uniref:Uncharacterized protein n=1 Tax=Candidatus Methanobinarius endosymbioticus TaxID=2006182 RepID=A0A366M9U8_9EURY|nr:hypothetical protein ALNOE001_12600 [Candidatus Methanobinarius endosymbioticus]